jgi:hypothetical protein
MTFVTTKRALAVGAAAVLAGTLGQASSASAYPRGPMTACGTFAFLTRTLTPAGTAGDGAAIFDEAATIAYSGDLTGVVVAGDKVVVHPDGSLSGRGSETGSVCTIAGHAGGFTAVFEFSGTADRVTGRERFVSATGGLAGLRVDGTFEAGPGGNTYAFDVHPARPRWLAVIRAASGSGKLTPAVTLP